MQLTQELLESIESSKFASYRAKISRELLCKEKFTPAKFEQRSEILVKLSFREMCDSNLSSLHLSDVAIFWVKNSSKSER